jgi:hypothetical protein
MTNHSHFFARAPVARVKSTTARTMRAFHLTAAAAAAVAAVALASPSSASPFSCAASGPGGVSWSLTLADNATTYSVTVNGQLWMPNGDTLVHIGGAWYWPVPGPSL